MNAPFRNSSRRAPSGFTILELLMVIVIIGILAGLGVPAIKGLTDSNKSAMATRQLADDLKLARAKAIAERTTVYVVFVPTNFTGLNLIQANYTLEPHYRRDTNLVQKLLNNKYTSYALFTWRGVGEQPGVRNPRFLTAWRSLPDGSFVAAREYEVAPMGVNPASAAWWRNLPGERPLPYELFPFPSDRSPDTLAMPYIAFNHLGQLVQPTYLGTPLGSQFDEFVHLAQGSIFYARNGATGRLNNEAIGEPFQSADLLETPPGNSSNFWVRVNWLTGRAQIDQPQIVD